MTVSAIGIDFGTTNTAVSVLEGGKARLLEIDAPNPVDRSLLKSLLYFPTRREGFFGHEAIEQYFERDMEGRFFQSVKRLLPNPDFNGTVIHGSHVAVEELVARFLAETRRRIEHTLGTPIGDTQVVMGRPARYSPEPGREGTAVVRFKKACALAGFSPSLRLMEEPEAAALTYEPEHDREERVLVVDLGGGTSDFTLMHLAQGGKASVLANHGIPVAGDSMDSAFVNAKLLPWFGADIRYIRPFSKNEMTMPTSFTKLLPKWHHHAFLKEKSVWDFLRNMHRELVDPKDKPLLDNLITLVEENLGYVLHQKVEELKIALSTADRADFVFRSHPIRIEIPVTRPEYEEIIAPHVEAIAATAAETARLAQVDPNHVDALYMTGGTSRIPAVRGAIRALFPRARIAEKETFTSVAMGLALSRREHPLGA